MLQRTILRASRQAARRSSPFTPVAQASATRATSTPALRWYSDAPAPKEGEAAEKKDEAPSEAAQLKESLEKKDKEIIDLKDKYLRSVADFRNLQIQTKREVTAARDFALQRFARDIVESVDNLDRALSVVTPESLTANKDLTTLYDGIKMTDGILISTLKKHGLERFDPSDAKEKFNPNVHEAVFQAPQPDKEDGTCFHTQQKGFMLNGRVLRPAKVGVVKNA
ncbi:mitochondrial co-chaperone-like protein GrpE [Dothidotthia symphoricarpi CBS 119687]|uniref:GrpE protein homolog n=1 Tax=Dothidotthia symphoricarpi CBS 119687 TaxID=1392245 RepID=A0A6A6AFP3_9PLEO|nr:mitochondrial co-chaperone-like protein GrpE [Dothidotthia symphoricarpi CBS 119687]KAF2130792.1 mitochondrial co-chaperone-like protein GrpE [Dothidotthia symphoricarpi CBS 119687]